MRKWFINIAITFDGKISLRDSQVNISDEEDWKIVHQMRNSIAAIGVGSNTILIDNPSLLVRKKYLPSKIKINHPIRLIFDRRGRLDPSAIVFHSQNLSQTIWITNSSKIISDIIKIPYTTLQEVVNSINTNLDNMNKEGSVMIEGGSQLISSFINENLISHIRAFRGNQVLPDGKPLFSKSPNNELVLTKVRKLGSGIEEYYDLKKLDRK